MVLSCLTASRKTIGFPPFPVIVLTARDAQSSEQRTLKSGATAFFQKPADNTKLLEVIRATLPKDTAVPVSLPS
jgi:FixJ family two-component response regulator